MVPIIAPIQINLTTIWIFCIETFIGFISVHHDEFCHPIAELYFHRQIWIYVKLKTDGKTVLTPFIFFSYLHPRSTVVYSTFKLSRPTPGTFKIRLVLEGFFNTVYFLVTLREIKFVS